MSDICLKPYIRPLLNAIIVAILMFSPSVSAQARQKGKAAPYYFKTVNVSFDSIARQVLNNEFNRAQSSANLNNVKKLTAIAAKSNNSVLKARAALWNIRANQIYASPDSCISILEKLRNAIPKEYDYDRACITYQLAGNNDRIGNYFVTYQLLRDAIPVFEKYGDNYFLGNAHLLMGLNYFNISEPDVAMEEIQLADTYYRKAGYPQTGFTTLKPHLPSPPKRSCVCSVNP